MKKKPFVTTKLHDRTGIHAPLINIFSIINSLTFECNIKVLNETWNFPVKHFIMKFQPLCMYITQNEIKCS